MPETATTVTIASPMQGTIVTTVEIVKSTREPDRLRSAQAATAWMTQPRFDLELKAIRMCRQLP